MEDTQSDARALMNLRQLLEEEFPSGLRLDELYAAYEVSGVLIPARV